MTVAAQIINVKMGLDVGSLLLDMGVFVYQGLLGPTVKLRVS